MEQAQMQIKADEQLNFLPEQSELQMCKQTVDKNSNDLDKCSRERIVDHGLF